jgi:hypothetical protein
MIHLLPNTAQQFAYFTPFEARKFLPAFAQYLLILESQATKATFACILNLVADNERYTKVGIGTNEADPEGSSVLITESGLYTYKIYGQNSETNTDPEDAVVVGICEVGTCKISDQPAWTIPNVSIPDNVIYYE